MPEWVVHTYTCTNFCGIPRDVCEEVNRFVDSPPHDKNRVIVDGHWLPEALLYLALAVYERWGYSGLKAVLHHNLLDYAHTLATGGKYGWLVRSYGPSHATAHIKGFVYEVLDNAERDFAKFLSMLRSGAALHDVIREVEGGWAGGIEYLSSFVAVLRRGDVVEFLDNLLGAIRELRDCLDSCVLEVVRLVSHGRDRFRDVCPLCFSSVYPSEGYVQVPAEYVGRGIAYTVHRNCFELLRGRAREMLREGYPAGEVLRRLSERSAPPSVAYEALKSVLGEVRQPTTPPPATERVPHRGLVEEPEEAVRVEDVDARWRNLKRRAIRWAEERSAHISPGATVVAYRRMPYVPERVAAFYRALDVMLESAKPTVLELLRSGRESEAEELLRGIAVRMFSNPLIVTFPPFAAPAGEGRVTLSPETVAGLAKVCEFAGMRVEPRVEWSREELLRLLDEVYGRVSAYGKGWVDVLRKMVW